uniref:Uncharacterized protein n=1 Tax=Moniliophthora roreri TaxID=221103 RepID=A0A0W0EZJ5_MONRR
MTKGSVSTFPDLYPFLKTIQHL